MTNLLRRIYEFQIERIIGTLIFVSIFLVMMSAVITRYGFGFSIYWAEEISRIGLIAIAFLGIGAGFRNNSHIQIDIKGRMPAGLRRAIDYANLVIAAAFLAVFAYYAFELSTLMQTTRSAALRFPMSWLYVGVSAAAVLGLLRLLGALFLRPKD